MSPSSRTNGEEARGGACREDRHGGGPKDLPGNTEPPGAASRARLAEIAVCVEGPPPPEGATIGGGVAAILTEIATLLERVAASGEVAAIDLRSLPMSAADRRRLLEALGPGEVEITLRADGDSSIRETGVQGVWWTEHRDRNGALIACYIEIARVPEILPVPEEELRRGAERLRAARAHA